MSDNNNSGIALVVLGLLGFLAIIITGKFILDNNRGPQRSQRPIIINGHHENRDHVEHECPPTLPYEPCPEYHNKNEFWVGYNDGWREVSPRIDCPEYIRGYDIGRHDRRLNRRYYYDTYCPPGFHIRVPGLRFEIR